MINCCIIDLLWWNSSKWEYKSSCDYEPNKNQVNSQLSGFLCHYLFERVIIRMIFISVLESHYSCCAHEWSEGAMMISDFIVGGSTTLDKCQHGIKMHLNYSILMMIKLLIPNKKVLDVAIVIHSFTHVWCPAIVVLLSYARGLTKWRGFLFHFKRNKGKFHRCHIKLISSLVFWYQISEDVEKLLLCC